MKAICASILFLLSVYNCWGQVSVEWMRSSAARRKRLEQAEPLQRNTLYIVPPASAEASAGARLGLALDRASVKAIWAEEKVFSLPFPQQAQPPRQSRLLLTLSAFRMARYWHLTKQTASILLEKSAYNYRLDFAKTPEDNVWISLTPVVNAAEKGAKVKLRFFMKPVTKWVYGLFMQACLDLPQPTPSCAEPVQIGRLSR